MDIDRQKEGRLLLGSLEKGSKEEICVLNILNEYLALFVKKGLLYGAQEVAKMLWRELKGGELATIRWRCIRDSRFNESKDALDMILLLEERRKRGLFVVE